MRGRLHANRLAYFRELEGDPVRADAYEGVGLLRGELDLTASIDGSRTERIKIPESEPTEPIEIRMNWTEHVNLICMNAAHSGGYTNIPLGRIDQFKRDQIEISRECLDFGKHAVLIIHVSQFVKRVKDAVRKIESYRLGGRLVRYSDQPPIDVTGIETIFHKRERYRSQREYRIAIYTGSDICNPLVLEVGDLSDIAIRCNSAEINEGIQMSFRPDDGEAGRAGGGGGVAGRGGGDGGGQPVGGWCGRGFA